MATTRPGLPAVVVVEERGEAGGPAGRAGLLADGVGTLAVRDALVDAPQPPRGVGEQLDGVGVGIGIDRRRRHPHVGALPVLVPEGLAGGIEHCVGHDRRCLVRHGARFWQVGLDAPAAAPSTLAPSPTSTEVQRRD